MLLDDFRFNDLGKSVLQCFLSETQQHLVLYEEDEFIRQAVAMTFDSFNELETSTLVAQRGKSSLAAVVLWFLSLETFFAKIVKITSLYTGKPFKEFQKDHICARIDSVCQELGIDKVIFQKTALRGKLHEFNEVRNCIFHAGSFQRTLKIKHTVFSSDPIFMNQVDVIQAADIAICTMIMFRYLFSEVDIIPTYYINFPPKQCVKYISVDILYKKAILNTFFDILKKHELQTSFNPLPQEILERNTTFKTKIIGSSSKTGAR